MVVALEEKLAPPPPPINQPDFDQVKFPSHLRKKKIGVYLGTYYDELDDLVRDLRTDDVQPRGVLVMGPPGTGKSTCCFIPTLLTYEESAFVYDPKGELFITTAGYRRDRMGQKILLFKPTDPKVSCRINIFDANRWGTIHEIDDVQNQVRLILDPSDKAAEGAEAHWIVCGSILLECTKMFLHYWDRTLCHLPGCYDFLSDPRWEDSTEEEGPTGVDACLQFMASTPLDPHLKNGWKDPITDEPTPFHPYIVASALEVKRKPTNEKGGVVSTTTRFLHPYRSDTLRAVTTASDFSFDDLMNYERPVTLYFVIPNSDVQRLRVVVRLFLNLLVRAHTSDEALTYDENGEPHYRYKWRCLLAVDEFPQLGKQEQFMLALAIMRSYGLWPLLGVQAPNQIFDAFGRYQAVTSMLYYKVFYKPNDHEAAQWVSDQLGPTTVLNVSTTYSGSRVGVKSQVSQSITPSKEPLMSPSMLTSMPESRAIITYGAEKNPDEWTNPIWAGKLYYKSNPELLRRSQFKPPDRSDVIRTPNIPRKRGEDELLKIAQAAVNKAHKEKAVAEAPTTPANETGDVNKRGTQATDGGGNDRHEPPSTRAGESSTSPDGFTAEGVVRSAETIIASTSNTISDADAPEGEEEDDAGDNAVSYNTTPSPIAGMSEFLELAEPIEGDDPPHELPEGFDDGETPFEEEDDE